MAITFDRQTKDWGLLVHSDGRTWDVEGETTAELRSAAADLAEILGFEIDVFNLELPEA
jgi:hypothetical protein